MTTPTLVLPGGCNIDFGSSLAEKARVRKAQFGDGYAQRVGDGLNSVTGQFSVRFSNLLHDEAEETLAFFRAQAGYKAFYYTPPGEADPRMWTCEEWSREYTEPTIESISATFEEVFTP